MSTVTPSFWDHLDELRGNIIRIIISIVACAVVAFCFKDALFGVVLAPQSADFITYRLLESVACKISGASSPDVAPMSVRLINTGLAQQFFIHIKTSLATGFMAALPYVIYQLFCFVSPALYANERRHTIRLVSWGYVMFVLGVLLSYFVVFPLTFRFLGMYQVSDVVENTVTIESYVDTLMTISVSMGLVFEIPVVCWILGSLGVMDARTMRRFRRHVVVALLVVGAVITPTSDVFTLMLVSLPMWLLYELSILIVALRER